MQYGKIDLIYASNLSNIIEKSPLEKRKNKVELKKGKIK